MAPERQVTQPTQVRVRRVALGTGPGQVTVLGQSFVPAWDLGGRQGWVSGTIERRLYEEGTATLRLANAAGADGQRHLDRLRCLSDPGYLPGDEWLEVYEGDQLVAVWTPTGRQSKRRTELQIAGEDATTLLKRTREGSAGFWCHAPRDVIEHYSRVWRARLAEGFDAGGPSFTYSTSGQATGVWTYVRCQSNQASWPGQVRMTSGGAGAIPELRSDGLQVPIGAASVADYGSWRMEAEIVPEALTATDFFTFSVYDAGNLVSIAAVDIYLDHVEYGSYNYQGLAPVTLPTRLGVGVPARIWIEGRDQWIFYGVNGRTIGVTPQDSPNYTAGVRLIGTQMANGSAVRVNYAAVRTCDRLLMGNRDGTMRLPGSPTSGGLFGEYFDCQDPVAKYQSNPPTAYAMFESPLLEPVASRVDAQVNFASSTPPSWRPAGVPPVYFGARWTGSVYLDLDHYDYAFRVSPAGSLNAADVRVADTRGGTGVLWGSLSTPWLKAGSSNASAPSGAAGVLKGEPSGWVPIRAQYRQIDAPGGIALEWERSDAPGTWTAVPSTALSPYGIYRDQIRNESHYDALKGVADMFGYQWACEPRSLESGEFPGRIVPRVRVGRDTEKVLDEPDAVDIQADLDLDSRADAIQADASGLADATGSAQLSAEMLDLPALASHLYVGEAYEALSEISSAGLLEQRLTTLLTLRSAVWEEVSARAPGRRELLDSWPLTGSLAEFAWTPGDGIRLNLPTVGVVDAFPRQILGITRDFVPSGMRPPSASFRPRPRSVKSLIRELRRDALVPQRNYQQQLVKIEGIMGTHGSYVGGADDASRIPLPSSPADIVSVELVLIVKSDTSAWTIAVNGTTTPIVVTSAGRYDVTSFVRFLPGGYNFAVLQAGGTGTGDWSIRLEATVRV